MTLLTKFIKVVECLLLMCVLALFSFSARDFGKHGFSVVDVQFSIAGCRPDLGKWAALVSAAYSARFSISRRYSAIENGTSTLSGQLQVTSDTFFRQIQNPKFKGRGLAKTGFVFIIS